MKLIARYILMLILAVIAGYLSSYLHVLGYRFIGAILAASLTIGVIIITICNNRSPVPFPPKRIIATGCICGLFAGIINELIFTQIYRYSTRDIQDQFIDIASCIAYGGALINAYSQYSRYIVDQFYNTLMHIVKAAFLIIMIRILILLSMQMLPSHDNSINCQLSISDSIIFGIIYFLGSTFPFSLSWFFVMTLSDPMWAKNRDSI